MCNFNANNAQKFKFEEAELTGIDVSKYQGNIEWNKVKNYIDFAMIRVGFRGYGESGTLNKDTYYETNITNALANNIDCGVYFFSQAKNGAEGNEEARWVINEIRNYDIKYPIAIDTEWANEEHTGRADNISVEDRTEAIKEFCQTIRDAGYTPIIYASKEWIYNQLNINELSEFDVWLAHYVVGAPNKKTDYTGKYTMWQYSSSGSVSGISGSVDLNISYKNYGE